MVFFSNQTYNVSKGNCAAAAVVVVVVLVVVWASWEVYVVHGECGWLSMGMVQILDGPAYGAEFRAGVSRHVRSVSGTGSSWANEPRVQVPLPPWTPGRTATQPP